MGSNTENRVYCLFGMTDPTGNPNFIVVYWMQTHRPTIVECLDEPLKVTVFSAGFVQRSLTLI